MQVPKREETIFFWSVVQTLRDYVLYNRGKNRPGTSRAYTFAKEWILGDIPKAKWGDSDLEISFEEAMDILGVAPENIEVIRQGLKDSVGKSLAERKEICRKIYADLSWQDNEPDPIWIHSANMVSQARGNYPRSIHLDEV